MNNGVHKAGPPRSGQGSAPGAAAANQTLLLEKVNARTSTPDSEALASSDDEGDHRQDPSQSNVPHPKPVRRSSWLNDTSQPFGRPRKGSFASSSMSPTASHPSTPSGETVAGPWGPHSGQPVMGRNSGSSNFTWGTGIWNPERKEAPTRFSEVLPSPTSTVSPGGSGMSFFGPNDGFAQTSPSRETNTNTQIPFAIPLHPTPKTYRSQSYSVGQVDPDTNAPAGMSASAVLGRARYPPALQHRPSRPSMLSEMSNDGSVLGEVKEVEDDADESAPDSLQNSLHQSSESKTIEMLTRENAMLRQQRYNSRMRPRASTGATYMANGYPLHEVVPEESDFAVDELDGDLDSGDSFAKRATARRLSELSVGGGQLRSPFGADGRKVDDSNLKRALWSSSFALPGADISQSRRHSFANMPTRQGSIGSLAESTTLTDTSVPEGQVAQDFGVPYVDSLGFGSGGNASYLPSAANMGNPLQPGYGTAYPSVYGLQNPFSNRAPSPHRNLYANMAQPRHNQLLHIVLFKCARADVFYIQEGTGLTVKPGDLVIVEADRGTDLGTVAKDNVDWQSAKDLKEHYAEEQYKWLMMYSQGAAAAQEGSGAGLLASSGGVQGSAIGGMGPPTQHHMQEPNSGELRPKLIKRLAQSHEVHALRDKEGQEAKAKRVCMQKVKEHGLNMEILDAEFQMDWKKLTFYYFADSYINFNSLVTDLFKIYKTRIWMSAINPASFASPTLGIQAPSGVGPGAVNANRNSGAGERRQVQQSQVNQTHAFGNGAQGSREFRQPFASAPAGPPGPVHSQPTYGFSQAGAFGSGRGNVGYVAGMSPNMEGFSYQQPDFPSMRHRFPTPTSGSSATPPHVQGMSPISPSNDWTGGFQGLSLNSH